MRSIIDAARNQENQKEPGPWNKAHGQKKGKLFGKTTIANDIGFEIHKDEDDNSTNCENLKKPCIPPITIAKNEIKWNKPFIYPTNFYEKANPIKGWITPVTTEEKPDRNAIPHYNKCKLYPRPNMEFSPEELKAYYVLRKRNIDNNFIKEHVVYWGRGPKYNIRMYPHFATLSKTQIVDESNEIYIPIKMPGMVVVFNEIYNNEHNVELQFEEILASRIKRNETITMPTDMEETMCITSEKIRRRKSFFPIRKSLAPATFKASCTTSLKSHSINDGVNSSPKDPIELKQISDCQPLRSYVDNETEEKNIDSAYNEEVDKKSTSPKIFEEFANESSTILVTNAPPANKANVAAENDFQFKTPSLPLLTAVTTASSGASNKIQFEIFEDENMPNSNTNHIAKTDTNCGTGGFFDPEETCSTQTFNIFLKAQSVSTPKAIAKCQPQRQICHVLQEVTPTIPEQKEDQQSKSYANNPTSLATATVTYSPPRQQLSTILETSEHGSTQGTHTTGATTKSTLSSPEIDLEYQIQTHMTTANQQQPILEPFKQLSCESSFVNSPVHCLQDVDKLMNSMQIVDVTDNVSKSQPEKFSTPAAVRLEKKTKNSGLNCSIFEDVREENEKRVGNFSRLEEKDDTGAEFAFKTVNQIHFQDDKTETITKVHITSQQIKFQDDKTETVPKIFLQPLPSCQFLEEKTEIKSKMLLDPLQPIQFSDDATETIPNFMLAAPKPTKFEDDIPETFNTKKEISQFEPLNKDDSFAFFGQTPPRAHLSHKRNTMDTQTPLSVNSKRICDNDTPDLQKSKLFVLFEDKVDPLKKLFNSESKIEVSDKSKILPKESIMQTFSLIEDKNNKEILKKSKSIFRDSFIPDFSIIEDSQPVTTKLSAAKVKAVDKSFLPEFSYIEGQQQKQARSVDNSYVPETQNLEPSVLKEIPKTSSTFVSKDIHWQRTVKDKAASNTTTEEGTNLENILMETFMKDFSEPHPLPKNDNLITLLQTSKKNVTLKFLNESVNTKTENVETNTGKSNISENVKNSPPLSTEKKISFLHAPRHTEATPQKQTTHSACNDNDKYFELNCETEMFGTNISMIKNSTWLPNHGPGSVNIICNKNMSQIQENSLHIKHEEISPTSFFSTVQDPQNSIYERTTKSKLSFLEKPSVCNNDYSIEISASDLAVINAKKLSTHSGQTIIIPESPEQQDDECCEMSIYYKKTPKTPKPKIHIWDDSDALKFSNNNNYVYTETDLNQTHQIIENMIIDPNVNPFNVDLINAFLEQHYVISYLESLPTCKLVGYVQRLKSHAKIDIKGVNFEVIKLIGEGAYGAVFW